MFKRPIDESLFPLVDYEALHAVLNKQLSPMILSLRSGCALVRHQDEVAAKELLLKAKTLEAKRLAEEERKRKMLRAEQVGAIPLAIAPHSVQTTLCSTGGQLNKTICSKSRDCCCQIVLFGGAFYELTSHGRRRFT